METNVLLETKTIGEIEGIFYVPDYQRGYRWTESQVEALLNDLWDKCEPDIQKDYCLQPIVVRRRESEKSYELIDGQQRFTTILILLNYIKRNYVPRTDIKFTLEYETREATSMFLSNINEVEAQNNIDFFHIFRANECIRNWACKKFNGDDNTIGDAMYSLRRYLFQKVKIIWYEVGIKESATDLFTRLNVGKIPLTNAELIRALLLKGDDETDGVEKKQIENSIQWDNIEKQLRSDDGDFWAFITRKEPESYSTRIDILFDMMSGKDETAIDPYSTFFWFDDAIKQKGVDNVWKAIKHDFLQIKEWYTDNEFYHKIGYLIASGHKTMPEIFKIAHGKKKSVFRAELNELIADSINFNKLKEGETYRDLNYEDDKWEINRLLLLFNVESIIKKGVYQRFPFSKFNKSNWSLEHIHAQQSEGLKSEKLWIEWIKLHIESVKSVSADSKNEELINKMEAISNGELKITRPVFNEIFNEVCNVLSEEDNSEYIHSLANMALLTSGDNAALNNSAFDVKRNKIVEMDKKGAFIPYCTKMVFLKYYTPSKDNQIHFWSKKDRDYYMEAMKEILEPYLLLINKSF